MKTFDTVKHRIPRRESLDKATGQAVYTEDMKLPGMVYAAIVRSPFARAQVTAIDLTEAEATPGYAGGEKELIARGGVDKKKSPS